MPKPWPSTAVVTAKTWAELQAELYHSRYTGPITVHLNGGVPASVDFPGPQIRLGGLDKATNRPDSS